MRIASSLGTGLDPRHGQNADGRERTVETLPAVVQTAHSAEKRPAASARPAATVVAQLVAGIEDVPEMRARRRADPGFSTERYRAVAKLGPAGPRSKARLV